MYQSNGQYPMRPRGPNPNYRPQFQDPPGPANQFDNFGNQNTYVRYPVRQPLDPHQQMDSRQQVGARRVSSYIPHKESPYDTNLQYCSDYPPTRPREYPPNIWEYPPSPQTGYPLNDPPAHQSDYPPNRRDYPPANNRDYPPANNRDYPLENNRDYPLENREYLPTNNREYPHHIRNSAPDLLDPAQRWDCFNCSLHFKTEAERDEHMDVCPNKPQTRARAELYESLDHPKPTRVRLIWKKEKPTLENKVQFYIQDGDPITLLWSDKEKRFQEEVELSVGEHGGLLNVNDINLAADVHPFYVAPNVMAKTQNIELELDDEGYLLKKAEELIGDGDGEERGEVGTKDDKKLKTQRKNEKDATHPEIGEEKGKQTEAAKKIKPAEKKECEKLKEQNKKLNEENSKMKNLNKACEDRLNKIEGEKDSLALSVAELKKDLEIKAAVSAAKKQLDKAYDECKSGLEARNKECQRLEHALDRKENEKTEISQQLSSLQAISEILQNREVDQQQELLEKRDRVSELADKINLQERQFRSREEEWKRDFEEQKAAIKHYSDQLSKSEKICESLRRESDSLLKNTAKTRNAPAMLRKSEVIDAPAEAEKGTRTQEREGAEGGRSSGEQALKQQLLKIETERNELLLKYAAAIKTDTKKGGKGKLKEGSKHPEKEKKNKKDTKDEKITSFFLETIESQEADLQELKTRLVEMRAHNFKLEHEKELLTQQLNEFNDPPPPRIDREVEPWPVHDQNSRVPPDEGNAASSPATHHPLSPVSTPTSPPPLNTSSLEGEPLGAQSNPEGKRLPTADKPGAVILDLPPPINIPQFSKETNSTEKDFEI